jgi:hypothetical protein
LVSVEVLKGVLVSITSLTEKDLTVSWICKKIEKSLKVAHNYFTRSNIHYTPIVHIDQYSVREYTNRTTSTEVKYEVVV